MKTTPKKTSIESKAGCIAGAMEIIGNKWTALILRDLFTGPKRFCELEKSVGKINPRTLSQRLDDLEAHGIITKKALQKSLPASNIPSLKKAKTYCPSLSKWPHGEPNTTAVTASFYL